MNAMKEHTNYLIIFASFYFLIKRNNDLFVYFFDFWLKIYFNNYHNLAY